MSLMATLEARSLSLGNFWIDWAPGQLTISDHHAGGRILWQSVAGEPFIAASKGGAEAKESRGFFHFRERFSPWTTAQTLASMALEGERLVLKGALSGSVQVGYSLALEVIDDAQLRTTVCLQTFICCAMNSVLAPFVYAMSRRADDANNLILVLCFLNK